MLRKLKNKIIKYFSISVVMLLSISAVGSGMANNSSETVQSVHAAKAATLEDWLGRTGVPCSTYVAHCVSSVSMYKKLRPYFGPSRVEEQEKMLDKAVANNVMTKVCNQGKKDSECDYQYGDIVVFEKEKIKINGKWVYSNNRRYPHIAIVGHKKGDDLLYQGGMHSNQSVIHWTTPQGFLEKGYGSSVPAHKRSRMFNVYRMNDDTGALQIIKKDASTGKKLAGAGFKITGPGGYNKTFTVPDSGILDVTGLKKGTYKVKETKAPTGYIVSSTTKTIKVEKGDEPKDNKVIVPNGKRGNLRLFKTDSKKRKLGGAEFKVTGPNNYSKTVKTAGSGDNKGYATIKNLIPGKYKVQETKAPNGYLLDDTVYSVTVKSGQTASQGTKEFNNETKQRIQIIKVDSETGDPVGGATFQVVGPSTFGTKSYTTKGKKPIVIPDVPVGTYTITETQAPPGYAISWPGETFTLSEGGSYGKTVIASDQPTPTNATVTKKDCDGNPLSNATFGVYSADDNDIYDKNELVQTLTTDANGQATTSEKLPFGNYYMKEDVAPDGYVADDSVKSFTLSSKNTSASVEFVDAKVQAIKTDLQGNGVAGATLSVYSADENGNITDSTPVDTWYTDGGYHNIDGLYTGRHYVLREDAAPYGFARAKDIKFQAPTSNNPQTLTLQMKDKRVIVKKSDTSGNFVADAHLQVLDAETKTVVIDETYTDPDGAPWYTTNLEIGKTYILHEAEAPKGYVKAKDVQFTVADDDKDQEVDMVDKRFYIKKTNHDASQAFNELNLHAQMTVVKKGGDPNNSADIVDQWWTDDTSVLESDGQYKNYHAVNGLEEGQTYTLHETQVPDGWVKATSEDFYVSEEKHDEEHVMRDKQYFIKKTDIFGVTLDDAHLEVRDDNGKVVDKWVTGKDTVIQTGEHKGYHAVSGLEEGKHYTLYETQAPKDYVIATPEGFTVTGADTNGIKYDQEQTMKDKQLHVRKQDLGGNEVEGAKMQVIDKDDGNKVVDSWTSGSKEYIVQNLREGHHYILHEEASPDGYVVATDVEFYINNNKINENYKMVDKRIRAIKTDVNRKNPIEGAKMSVIDKDSGKTVDTWTSGKKFHYINGLVEGKTYILREEKAPKGYVRANDVLFTVSRAKETQTVYMTDKRVLISKKGVKIDSEVQGAKMAIYESEDGKITNDVAVDTWTTTDKPHYADGLSEGHEYTLVELRAPKGFVKAKPITFIATAASEDGIKADQLEVMVDKIFDVTKTDVSGKKEVPGAKLTVTDSETGKVIDTWISTTKAHHVSGLEEGRTYTLTEKRAPKGYVTAESVQFYVTEEKVNQHYKMKDKQVTVTKTDITGKKEVPGAELVVTDKKTGKKVDSWTSTTKKHYVNGLVENHDYVLTEKRAPKGYVQAESVTFRVTGEKVNQKHYMKDKQVTVTKTDITGTTEIPGATLIVREKGKIIDKWVSTSKPHPVSGLKEGHTYVLTEKRAPSGYVKAESVKFYVSKDKIDQKHYMKDKQVLVSKQDITNKKELPGAHLTVTDKKTGKVVDSWTSTNEQHPVNGLEENRKYILTEVTAPNGYLKAESIEFFVSKEKVIQHVKMFDRPVAPKTGDDTNSTVYIAGAAVSLIVIAGAVVMKLKKGKKKE